MLFLPWPAISPSDGVPGRHAQAQESPARSAPEWPRSCGTAGKVTTGVRLLGNTCRQDDLPVGQAPWPAPRAHSPAAGCAKTRPAHSRSGPSSQTNSAAPATATRWVQTHGKNDQQIQLGHGAPDLDEALEGQVGLAAEKALDGTGHQAQQHATTVSARANSTDRRNPYSSRASTSRPRSSVPSQLSAGRRGVRFLGKVVQRGVVVGVGRVNRPVARLLELLAG
jgi:hypothetical protein